MDTVCEVAAKCVVCMEASSKIQCLMLVGLLSQVLLSVRGAIGIPQA